MTLKKGAQLGLYRIEEPLGTGGMGEVYRARDPRLDRDVAIKVLHWHSTDPDNVKRFRIEARAVAALTHPNILVIHDVGRQGDRHYAVTELLDGQTLKDRLLRGRLPLDEALRVGIALCDGLAAAHARGVIHRDLKPSNVMLTRDGRVKILDFGLALLDDRFHPESPSRPTPDGTMLGTSGYMAPEQFFGEGIDHRSDIFALGCVLYEMLSGRRAYDFKSLGEAVMTILDEEPLTLGFLDESIPAGLVKIVERCLEKKPAHRFGSVNHVGAALRRCAAEAEPVMEPARVRSLAVLPFDNAGGQPEGEYLSDGLSESIIRGLSRWRDARVLAWGTSSRYRGSPLPPSEIGRQLGVDAVVAGRVLERDQRLIVTAELISSEGGEYLWGEKFDRHFTDVLDVLEEIAERLSEHLHDRVTAPPPELPRETESTEAYRLYLRGRYFWNRRTRDGLERGRACFEQALRVDPSYALAWSGLADAYNVMPFWGLAPPRDSFPRAKAAARQAIELDPALAEARASLAYVRFYYDWDWPAASAAFRESLELRPRYATAHHWHGVCAALMGDFDVAFGELERARAIDPLSLMVNADLALARYLRGETEQALAQCREVEELAADFAPVHLYRGLALEQCGRAGDAVDAFRRAVELTERSSPALAAYAHGLALAGRHAEARETLAELLALAGERYVSNYPVAVIHHGLGDSKAAIRWLERAFEERSEMMPWLAVDPRLADLRAHRRCRKLLRRRDDPRPP